MFSEMGQLSEALYQPLIDQTIRFLEKALPSDEYLGWLAAPSGSPGQIVAGAGVQQRRVLPHPLRHARAEALAPGRQAIVLNVFTEPEWRRRGIAELLMKQVIEWARASDLDTLVLHASNDGRPLYERLGFEQTNEMRFAGDLHSR